MLTSGMMQAQSIPQVLQHDKIEYRLQEIGK